MLDVYDKDQADDLTPEARQLLAGLAEEYRTSAKERQERKGRS